MTVDAALFREQRVNVAVIVVKRHVLDYPMQRDQARKSFATRFPGYQIVLMGQDHRGTPTYFGRKDITSFLSQMPLRALPFKRYHLS